MGLCSRLWGLAGDVTVLLNLLLRVRLAGIYVVASYAFDKLGFNLPTK